MCGLAVLRQTATLEGYAMQMRSTLFLAVAFLSIGAVADAQIRAAPHQQLRVLPDDAAPLAQRVAALEAQVSALSTRLDQAENAAAQANFKAGAATNWLDAHGAMLLNHTHDYTDTTRWVNHSCENAHSGSDSVPCSQVTGSSPGRTSEPRDGSE